MGSAISKAANGIGGLLGSVFSAPFKTLLGASCQDVCAGPWDVLCFIEHLCASDLVKLVMILGLCYLTLLFFYLLFKVGICQCIGRSLCNMCWAACETCWFGLEYIACFCWHKLKNTKRVHRRPFRDIEKGYRTSSTSETSNYSDYNYGQLSVGRKRKSGITKVQRRHISSSNRHVRHRLRQRVRLQNREISLLVKGRSQRQVQLIKAKNHRRNLEMLKRRRLR